MDATTEARGVLILPATALAKAGENDPAQVWPGRLCAWTLRAAAPPAPLPPAALTVDFDPPPEGLLATLSAILTRLRYFGHRPEGAVLCALRLPDAAEAERLRARAAADPFAVEAPGRRPWRLGRGADGLVMLGADLSRHGGLCAALSALPPDPDDARARADLAALAARLRAQAGAPA